MDNTAKQEKIEQLDVLNQKILALTHIFQEIKGNSFLSPSITNELMANDLSNVYEAIDDFARSEIIDIILEERAFLMQLYGKIINQ